MCRTVSRIHTKRSRDASTAQRWKPVITHFLLWSHVQDCIKKSHDTVTYLRAQLNAENQRAESLAREAVMVRTQPKVMKAASEKEASVSRSSEDSGGRDRQALLKMQSQMQSTEKRVEAAEAQARDLRDYIESLEAQVWCCIAMSGWLRRGLSRNDMLSFCIDRCVELGISVIFRFLAILVCWARVSNF